MGKAACSGGIRDGVQQAGAGSINTLPIILVRAASPAVLLLPGLCVVRLLSRLGATLPLDLRTFDVALALRSGLLPCLISLLRRALASRLLTLLEFAPHDLLTLFLMVWQIPALWLGLAGAAHDFIGRRSFGDRPAIRSTPFLRRPVIPRSLNTRVTLRAQTITLCGLHGIANRIRAWIGIRSAARPAVRGVTAIVAIVRGRRPARLFAHRIGETSVARKTRSRRGWFSLDDDLPVHHGLRWHTYISAHRIGHAQSAFTSGLNLRSER
jgi:hypothetical protein